MVAGAVLPTVTLLSMSPLFWFSHPWWRQGSLMVSAMLAMAVVQGVMHGAFAGAFDWTMPGLSNLSEWAWRHHRVTLAPVWSVWVAASLFALVVGGSSLALIVRGTGRRRQGWLPHHR